MLVVEVELLTGRYAATAHDDRRRAEWPPHPARFFSALVAALYDRDPADQIERSALLWLERQPAPGLDVDLDVDGDVGRRQVHDVFVPVNDLSIAGNAWPLVDALRAAEAALARVEQTADPKQRGRETTFARKQVESARKRLSDFMGRVLTRSREPSKSDLKVAAALMPDRRTRRMRTFPVVVPSRPTFSFAWGTDPSPEIRAALESLCGRVTRLGHSSSLVRCAVVDSCAPNLVPAHDGEWVLRVVSEGQLARLDADFGRDQGVESRVLPAQPQRYGRPATSVARSAPRSVFAEDWILYERRGGARPLSSRGTDVARALRAALIEANGSDEALPAMLSGHGQNGQPSERPHVAFVACPWVGHPNADGSIQGCAILLPRGIAETDRRRLLRLVAEWEKRTAREGMLELAGEGLPPVRLARVQTSERWALSPSRWCRASSRFVTATPIALNRHPGNLRSNAAGTAHRASLEAQRTIADACEHIGLPRPVSVEIGLAPMLAGAQPVHAFRPWPDRPGRFARARVHAEICFDRPVRGPVVLGAGRYFGLGLCLPVNDRVDR